jgi:hypothetical protein
MQYGSEDPGDPKKQHPSSRSCSRTNTEDAIFLWGSGRQSVRISRRTWSRLPLRRSVHHRRATRGSRAISRVLACRPEGRQEGDLHRCIHGVQSRRVPGGSAGRVSSSPCGPAGSDGEQFDERDHCRNPPLPSNISRSDVERPIAAMPASASPNAPDHRRGRLVGGTVIASNNARQRWRQACCQTDSTCAEVRTLPRAPPAQAKEIRSLAYQLRDPRRPLWRFFRRCWDFRMATFSGAC